MHSRAGRHSVPLAQSSMRNSGWACVCVFPCWPFSLARNLVCRDMWSVSRGLQILEGEWCKVARCNGKYPVSRCCCLGCSACTLWVRLSSALVHLILKHEDLIMKGGLSLSSRHLKKQGINLHYICSVFGALACSQVYRK